jgi:ribonuclease HI
MPKSVYYVVWNGRRPGVYHGWGHCKEQVDGFAGAKYKGFPTKELAEAAWADDPAKYLSRNLHAPKKIVCANPLIGEPIPDSICVDAACAGNPGVLEYQGVDTKSGVLLFHSGPFPEGTVNLGEFLAIVHALAYLKQRGSGWPVYSDSKTAMKWVRDKQIKTMLERNSRTEKLFERIDRALAWLKNNRYPNKIFKWETAYWGEIPADFGRK